jgi:hypothetical protein
VFEARSRTIPDFELVQHPRQAPLGHLSELGRDAELRPELFYLLFP